MLPIFSGSEAARSACLPSISFFRAVTSTNAIIARQPIFDTKDQLVGFELLFRADREATDSGGATTAVVASSTVLQAVLSIGLEKLAEGARVWLNCTEELLVERGWEVLDPARVTLEVLETVEPTEAVIAACRDAKAKGYRVALDDFVFSPAWIPLLELCDVVKIDVLGRTTEELAAIVASLRRYKVPLLAERVETEAMRATCARLGFRLFQGYFYQRPETVVRRDLPVGAAAAFRLMSLVGDESTPTAELDATIRRDPGLAFKLLRLVNNASTGVRGVESIEHALLLTGRTTLSRWLSMLLMADMARGGGRRREQFKLGLTRARLLELLDAEGDPGARFLLGLVSMLPTLLDTTADELVERLQLARPLAEALLDRVRPWGPLLTAVEAYEVGDWAAVEAAEGGPGLAAVARHYPTALAWAIEQVAGME